jgi:hypothetical protein
MHARSRSDAYGDLSRLKCHARTIARLTAPRQRYGCLPTRVSCFTMRRPAGAVRSALAAIVRPFARTRVSRRIDGVQRAVRATDDVDEVHASIAASSTLNPRSTTERLRPDTS